MLYRQGDVLLEDVNTLPATAKPKKGRVLASGEITGHRHDIKERRGARLYENTAGAASERLYLVVTAERVTLRHPEHAAIEIPRGTYRVWQQREFVDGGLRTVAD